MTSSGDGSSNPKVGMVDVGLYAPIGLLSLVAEQIPAMVERGRARVEQRIVVARFVGELVVNQARLQLERRCSPSSPAGSPGGPVPGADTGAPEPAAHVAPSREPEVVRTDVGAVRAPGPSAEDLPIDGYEHLPASHVISLLPELRADELDLVEEFERANRNRRTVLGRVAQLRRPA